MIDVSRSMLASSDLGAPHRFERAKEAASELRHGLRRPRRTRVIHRPRAAAPFPDREREGVRGDRGALARDRATAAALDLPDQRDVARRALDRARPALSLLRPRTARVVIVLTDGESDPVVEYAPGQPLSRDPAIGLVFVQFWGEDEKVFSRGVPEPQYVADPSARSILDRLAASTGGAVYSEHEVGAATRKTKALLGSGPTVVEGQNAGKVALAPYSPSSPCSRSVSSCGAETAEELLVREPHLNGFGEAALVHVRDRAAREPGHGLRARARQHGPHRLVARLRPALLARPRAPEPAESERGAIDVARMLSVPVDADRPISSAAASSANVPASSAATKLLLLRGFSFAPGICIPPPNRIGTASSQKYDPALDHGD